MAKKSIYKVGDKVKILSKYPTGLSRHNFPFSFTQKMLGIYGGKVATVMKVLECSDDSYNSWNTQGIDPALLDGYKYLLDIDDGRWHWSAPMFEYHSFIIQSGMLVQFENGEKELAYLDSCTGKVCTFGLDPEKPGCCTNIQDYFDNPNTQWNPIVAVGWPAQNYLSDDLPLDFKKVLWKKEEVVELTLDEIASRLNIPVAKLRIKE